MTEEIVAPRLAHGHARLAFLLALRVFVVAAGGVCLFVLFYSSKILVCVTLQTHLSHLKTKITCSLFTFVGALGMKRVRIYSWSN